MKQHPVTLGVKYTPRDISNTLLCFSIPFICGANGVIIISFLLNKSLRNIAANYAICSHACVNFLIGSVLIPVALYGPVEILGPIIMFTLMVALLTLTVCIYDRYISVKMSSQKIKKTRIKILTGVAWIFPLAIAPLPLAWNGSARRSSTQHKIYLSLILTFILIIVVVCLIAYIAIFRISYIKLTTMNMLNHGYRSFQQCSRETKYVKLFALTSMTFMFFWLPTCYINFVDAVLNRPDILPPDWVIKASYFWLLISSMLNPFVIALSQKRFRTVIKNWFKCELGLKANSFKSDVEEYEVL